jgi:NTP pyrophosphatase (non-canonical NTP hydrolase)
LDLTALQSTLRQFAAERDWQPFHTPKNLAMALMVEAAELAELFQWMTPEQSQAACTDRVTQERVADEVSDVLLCLLQIADRTGVDLKRAVGRKLVKNASKHPPVRPGIAAGASGPSRVDTHVLVDWENVRPDDADIRRLVPDVTDVWLFHAPDQKAVGARHASFGEQLTVVKTSRPGRNALDMHLSFYLGHIAARYPEARFVVVSNDQDYLPVLEHAVERGFAARLIGFDAAAAKVAARKTAAKAGSAERRTAARSAAADNVAAEKGAAQETAAKQAAGKQPAAKKVRAQEGASQEGASLERASQKRASQKRASQNGVSQKVAPARTRGSKPPRDGQAEPLTRSRPMPQATQPPSQEASPKPSQPAKRGRKQEPARPAMAAPAPAPTTAPTTAPATARATATATAAGPLKEPASNAAPSKRLHAKASPASTATPAAKTKSSSAKAGTAPATVVTPAQKAPPAKKAAAETSPAKTSAARTSAAKTAPAKTSASNKPASRRPPTAAEARSPRRNGSGALDGNKALAHVLASLKTMSRPTRQARLLATVKSLLGPSADEQAVNAMLAQLLASGKVSIDAAGAVGYAL